MSARLAMAALSLLCAASLFAEPPVPIDVRADRLELNINGGRQLLSGNVVVQQGSLTLSADRLQVDMKKGAITRIYGSGTPIVVTDNTPGSTSLRASAQFIDYQTSSWQIVIEGEVTLERPGWRARGNKIVYDIRKALYVMTGSPQAPVRATLQPKLSAD